MYTKEISFMKLNEFYHNNWFDLQPKGPVIWTQWFFLNNNV